MRLSKFVLTGLTGIFVTGVMICSVYEYLNFDTSPDVFISNGSGRCTKVQNYDDRNFTCDNLPETYNRIWVK